MKKLSIICSWNIDGCLSEAKDRVSGTLSQHSQPSDVSVNGWAYKGLTLTLERGVHSSNSQSCFLLITNIIFSKLPSNGSFGCLQRIKSKHSDWPHCKLAWSVHIPSIWRLWINIAGTHLPGINDMWWWWYERTAPCWHGICCFETAQLHLVLLTLLSPASTCYYCFIDITSVNFIFVCFFYTPTC